MNKTLFIAGGVIILGAVGVLAFNASKNPETLIDRDREAAYELLEEAQENAMRADEADEMERAAEPKVELSYKHVVPNKYSEIYVVVSNFTRGNTAAARIAQGVFDPNTGGTSYDNYREEKVTVDENGTAHFTFRITSYGKYSVSVVDLDSGAAVGGLEIVVE